MPAWEWDAAQMQDNIPGAQPHTTTPPMPSTPAAPDIMRHNQHDCAQLLGSATVPHAGTGATAKWIHSNWERTQRQKACKSTFQTPHEIVLMLTWLMLGRATSPQPNQALEDSRTQTFNNSQTVSKVISTRRMACSRCSCLLTGSPRALSLSLSFVSSSCRHCRHKAIQERC